jgi:ABC-type lipoprotein export system ATPase subunit
MDQLVAVRKKHRVSGRRGRAQFYRYLKNRYNLSAGTTFIESCQLKRRLPKKQFTLGVVVGPSGSGKTSTLRLFRPAQTIKTRVRPGRPLMQYFRSPARAERMLAAVALNNILDWMQPFDKLSGGQQFRASLALALDRWSQKTHYLVIDEFCSYVDDVTSQAISFRFQKHLRRAGCTGVVLATLKPQLLRYLRPDWVLYTDATRCAVERPRWPAIRLQITMTLITGHVLSVWKRFRQYHYLSHSFGPAARAFLVRCNGEVCGFHASLRHMQPTSIVFAHRTVILPEYQGFGIGPAVHCLMGSYVRMCDKGLRFRVITSHINMIESMKRKPRWWRLLYSNIKRKLKDEFYRRDNRTLSNFEYVGPKYRGKVMRLWRNDLTKPKTKDLTLKMSLNYA